MENIDKIWGKRHRIFLDNMHETDLLYLKKDSFCSTHTHKTKINRFYVITGKVQIETEFGKTILLSGESWVCRPPIKHRFVVLEPSIMIEMAYVEKGKIDPNDINRESQGGLIIKGKEYTLEELKDKGMLEL